MRRTARTDPDNLRKLDAADHGHHHVGKVAPMPPPPASNPDEPPALSGREREILAAIEHDLDASAPRLAREMARPMATAPPVPAGAVEAGFLVISLFVVLGVAGLVPAVVWALLAVIGAMVVVPWAMLRVFERYERPSEDDGG
jgi:Protein of unknown function (DUF3040)